MDSPREEILLNIVVHYQKNTVVNDLGFASQLFFRAVWVSSEHFLYLEPEEVNGESKTTNNNDVIHETQPNPSLVQVPQCRGITESVTDIITAHKQTDKEYRIDRRQIV